MIKMLWVAAMISALLSISACVPTETVTVSNAGITLTQTESITVTESRLPVTATLTVTSPETTVFYTLGTQVENFPSKLYFKTAVTGQTPVQKVQVQTLDGSMDWQVSADAAWLRVSPSKGTAVTESRNISVSCDTSGLVTGSYHGTVSIKTPGSDIPLPVEMVVVAPVEVQPETGAPINPWPTQWPSTTITSATATITLVSHPPPPMLSIGASIVSFATTAGMNPAPQNRLISAGYDDTAWAATTDVPWLIVAPMNGVASPVQKPVGLSADVSGLTPGTYKGNVYIDAHVFNAPVILSVELVVR
jgi:hypothetical protein